MDTVLLLIFLGSITLLLVGVVKPSFLGKRSKDLGRKKIAMIFSATTVASFILFGVFVDTPPQEKVELQDATESVISEDLENREGEVGIDTNEDVLVSQETPNEGSSSPQTAPAIPPATTPTTPTAGAPAPNAPQQQEQQAPASQGYFYTSSHYSAQYYYPEACSGWKGLSPTYLKQFSSVQALLTAYPNRTLNPNC